MATPTTGEISISDLQNLYSPVRTAPGKLGDYHAGGSVVASGEKLSGGAGAAIPTAPSELSLSDFYDLRATVHGAALTASTAASVFDGIDVSWTASGNGESADSWQIGWRPSPSTDAYTYLSTDYQGNPITSTSATVTIPSTPGATLHDLVVRGINAFGTGVDSSPQTAYKKAPTADYLYDTPVSSTVGSIAGQGISTVHVYAAVGAGGATGPYFFTGGDGPGAGESPFSADGGMWWWPHYTYQVDMAGAGGGGSGGIGYRATSIPVTPSTPVSITVGQSTSGTGGTTTVNIGGTNYVVANGGAVGGRGGLITGGSPGTPAGLPSTYIPTSPIEAITSGPKTEANFMQKGYFYYNPPSNNWYPPTNNPTVSQSEAEQHFDRAATALRWGVAGDGGAAGGIPTGTTAQSPTHTNSGAGYAGVNVEHNRPITAWPNTFGQMHGAGGVGYTITVPNTDTVPGLPGNVPLNGPAYPGSGSLTVNVGYGSSWKSTAFPAPYGKVYQDGTGHPGTTSIPGHVAFSDTPTAQMTSPTYVDEAGDGFVWVRFNDAPGSISATSYSEYSSPTWPTQHKANGTSVPSDGINYFGRGPALVGPAPGSGPYSPIGIPAGTAFAPNHQEPISGTGQGATIGGGASLTPSPGHVNKTQKVTYFPLISSSGVTVDPGTLGQTQAYTNHAVTISPDNTNKAYSAGGYGLYVPGSTDEGMQTAISRFEFPSTSITSSVTTLSTGRASHTGFSLGVSNRGYVGGGWTSGLTGPQAAVNTMEAFIFPSETTAAEPNNIGTARMHSASAASMDYGYTISGKTTFPIPATTGTDEITRFAGASGSTTISVSDLGEFPSSGAILAWSTLGYIMTSDAEQTGFSTVALASNNRSVNYGEHRDKWFGTLRNNGFFPQAPNATVAGTAVSGRAHGFLLTAPGRIEKFPFSSGVYAVDSTQELSPTSSTYGYGYGAPGVG